MRLFAGAVCLLSAFAQPIFAQDNNPPIDNDSVTVDFSNALIIQSDKAGYSGMIKVDNTHKIYLKCMDVTDAAGDIQETTTLVPCTTQGGHLVMEQATWAPYHALETVLFFEPKASSIKGVISGSIGSSTVYPENILGVNADSMPLLRIKNPPPEFEYPFASPQDLTLPSSNFSMADSSDPGVSILKLVAEFLQTIGGAVGDANAYYKVNLNSVTWTTQAQYKLDVRTLNGGDIVVGDPETVIEHPAPVKIKYGSTIILPLGARAKFTLKNVADGSDIDASYSFNDTPLFNPAISSDDQSKGLYMDRLGFLFGSGYVTDQESVWLHMGSQTLTITPKDPTKPAITINIVVDRPASVGSGSYDCSYTSNGKVLDLEYTAANGGCDALAIDEGHRTGLPPQYIKAEMWEESYKHTFRKDSYRYEPNFDARYISKLSNVEYDRLKKIYTLKSDNKYFFYSFRSTSTGNLTQMQIHLRSIYKATLNSGIIGPIPDNFETSFGRAINYKPLSILNIVNSDVKNGDLENWFTIQKKKPDSYYNRVAQTVAGSSYGILQMLYTTAVDFMGYEKTKDPLELFRPRTSISLGARYLARQYRDRNKDDGLSTDRFDKFENYYQRLKNASGGYKGGIYYDDPDKIAYAEEVIKRTKHYWVTGPLVINP